MMKFEQIKNTFSLFSLINKIYNEVIVFTWRSVFSKISMSIHTNKFSESIKQGYTIQSRGFATAGCYIKKSKVFLFNNKLDFAIDQSDAKKIHGQFILVYDQSDTEKIVFEYEFNNLLPKNSRIILENNYNAKISNDADLASKFSINSSTLSDNELIKQIQKLNYYIKTSKTDVEKIRIEEASKVHVYIGNATSQQKVVVIDQKTGLTNIKPTKLVSKINLDCKNKDQFVVLNEEAILVSKLDLSLLSEHPNSQTYVSSIKSEINIIADEIKNKN